jgi:hypothetical protein
MKTHFLRSKFQKKIIEKKFTGPTDTTNFNQVLSKHLNDIVFYNLTFFGANMARFKYTLTNVLPFDLVNRTSLMENTLMQFLPLNKVFRREKIENIPKTALV